MFPTKRLLLRTKPRFLKSTIPPLSPLDTTHLLTVHTLVLQKSTSLTKINTAGLTRTRLVLAATGDIHAANGLLPVSRNLTSTFEKLHTQSLHAAQRM